MRKQVLLHDYYYSYAFNSSCINIWQNFYIHTDTGDALSGLTRLRIQTYLHLKISDIFSTHFRLVSFWNLLVASLYLSLGASNLY